MASKEKEPLINKPKEYSYPEENPDFQGYSLNQELEDGPLEKRRCQDVFFVILYFLFWILMFIVAGFAFINGNPTLLATPFDPSGRQCGYKNDKGDAIGYDYLYFQETSTKDFMCVKKCPTKIGEEVECLTNQRVNKCPINKYESFQVVKVCNPQSNTLADKITNLVNIGDINEWVSDLQNSWPIFIAVSFIALFISFIVILLIKYLAGCLVWSVISLYFIGITSLGAMLIYQAESGKQSDLPDALQNKDTLLALGISLLVLSGISLLIFACLFQKIKIAIGILKASSLFVKQVPTVLTIPFLLFIKAFAFFLFWIAVCIYIYSCGTVSQNPDLTQPFGQITWMVGVKRSFFTYLIGLMWTIDLILSIGQFTIASSTAFWYYSHIPGNSLHSPVLSSFKRAYTYQFGSLCFGAFVLTVIKLIVLMLDTLHRNIKNQQGSDPTGASACAACAVKCAKCCVKCFQRFIQFLSERAFIMMALEGKGFCASAYDSFYLIIRNKVVYAVVSYIGQLFVFFSMLFICVTSTFIGYLIITNVEQYEVMLYGPAIPTLFFFLISYTIAYVCMQVYGMSSDSLLMYLCADRELSKGKGKSIPPVLQLFIDKYL